MWLLSSSWCFGYIPMAFSWHSQGELCLPYRIAASFHFAASSFSSQFFCHNFTSLSLLVYAHILLVLVALPLGAITLRLRYCCLFTYLFSHKLALHIMATFFCFLEIIYAIPGNVFNIAYGIPSLVTTLKSIAPAPFNGYMTKRAWWKDLHYILNVLKKRCPSQLAQIGMWKNIDTLVHHHSLSLHTQPPWNS